MGKHKGKQYPKTYQPTAKKKVNRRKKIKYSVWKMFDFLVVVGIPLLPFLLFLVFPFLAVLGGIYLFLQGGDERLGGVLCFVVAAIGIWLLVQVKEHFKTLLVMAIAILTSDYEKEDSILFGPKMRKKSKRNGKRNEKGI